MSKSWPEVIENIDLSTKPLREPRKLSCDEITDLKEKCNPKYDLTILDLICTIEALQQENEQLADETIKLMKENAKNSNKKDELVKVLKQARDAIDGYSNGYSTCPYCWGVNGHAKGCKFYEALQNIDALIGGKEDV